MRLRVSSFVAPITWFTGALLILAGCGQAAAAPQPTTPTLAVQMTMPAPTSAPASASTPTEPAASTGAQVVIDNFTFSPQTLNVKVGTTVTWVNHDDTPHTVTSVDKIFGSNALDTGDQFTYQFIKPGTYKYYCTIHPVMTATIVVQ